MSHPPSTHPHQDVDHIQLVDFAELRNWVMFVVHSARRRWRLGLSVLAAGLLGTLVVWVLLPRTYHVDVQLLAKRNSLMSALGNPGRKVPLDADSPTLGAAEAVLRRDNLLLVMKQTELLKRWEETRPRLLRLKDRVMIFIDPLSDDDRTNAMIGLLERRISVTTGDATVTISVDWTEAPLAYHLADSAMENFLEQRRAVEVSTIAETISILEGHAKTLREAIDSAIEDMRRPPVPSPKAADAAGTPPPPPRRDPAQEALRAEGAEVRVTLEAKRRSIKELQDYRRRRLLELQSELAQQRAVYADAHPNVVKVEQLIAALEEDSPQLAALRKDESDLMAQAAKLSGMRLESSSAQVSRVAAAEPGAGRRNEAEDLRRDYARTSLRFAMEKYDSLQERIDSARIELDTAQAAFKYRYNVIRPPVLPRRPVKPKLPIVLGAGALASVFLAIVAATLADLRSGRILESWQAEKLFGLSLLGNVPRAAK